MNDDMDDLEERMEMVRDFVTESRELLDSAEPQIIDMEKTANDSGKVDEDILNAIFRLFHSLKGTASFLDLQNIIGVTHEAETLLEIFRKDRAVVAPGHVDLLCRTSDFIRDMLDIVERKLTDEGYESEAGELIGDLKQAINDASGRETAGELIGDLKQAINDASGREPADEQSDNAGQHPPDEHSPGELEHFPAAGIQSPAELPQQLLTPSTIEQRRTIFTPIRPNESRNTSPEKTPEEPSPVAPDASASSVLHDAGAPREGGASMLDIAPPAPVVPDWCPQPTSPDHPALPAKQQSQAQQQVIRVDIDKLDKMLDLVGELVIAESMVANNQGADRFENDRLVKAITQLDKISREIQEVAMSMRMIPLAGIFNKMVRLVRDLSHQAGKQVDLLIVGEETEVDKTIIEQISDPLVHLIRNAIHHGIEDAPTRLAAGKPETGRVTLDAKHSAGEVWITVEDDGAGLNRKKIFERGVEKHLIRNEDAAMKDEEIWRLIFEPGFSTSENVSNISGQGIGMDVVRRNIERLRGKVDIRTREGVGTMFIIRIPLTLAIIEGMVVRVGANRYAIPISSIKESFRPSPGQITATPDGLEIVRVRGELQPVLRLHELYRVEPLHRQLADGILIIVENTENRCCLFVDELLGHQQIVIKTLPDYLHHVKGISGCSILNDGEIGMILDVAGILSSVDEIAQLKIN